MTNADGKLPVVTEQTNDECGGGCDRRILLKGLAIASVAGACRIDVGSEGDDVDPPADAPVVDVGFELCGTSMVCVDLSNAMNAALATAGGSRVIQTGNTRVIIIRTTATTFVTLSARCTHAGTTVGYRAAMNDIRCPNHGSLYQLDGSVKGPPAVSPLAEFDHTFDEAGALLTINLV
jgi:cytochrome b6-f complex iron-sulfur subunit